MVKKGVSVCVCVCGWVAWCVVIGHFSKGEGNMLCSSSCCFLGRVCVCVCASESHTHKTQEKM